jgi:hypothetical protein
MSRWWTLKHRRTARIILATMMVVLSLLVLMVGVRGPQHWAAELARIDGQLPLLAPVTLFATGLLSGASVYTGNHQYNANYIEWFLFWFAIIGSACGWLWMAARLMSFYLWP